jgi:hypothetical protein
MLIALYGSYRYHFNCFWNYYLVKPDIYGRWIWKKTDIAQRVLSPKRYILFMRILGGVFVVVGCFLVLRQV